MEKTLLKEELIRIWEIMGVKGNQQLIRESLIDDFIGMVVKVAAKGGPDLMQNSAARIQKVLDDFPYLKGIDADAIGKLAKGGDEAVSVIKQVLGNLEPADLASLSDDIFKNSTEMKNLVDDQFGGLKTNIGNGYLSKQEAMDFVDIEAKNWIRASDVDVPPALIDNLRNKVATEVKIKINSISSPGTPITTAAKTAEELAQEAKVQEIMATLGKFEGAVDDVTGEVATPSKIKEAILESAEFNKAYDALPARVRKNVTKEQFAQQVASDLSSRAKTAVENLPPQLWKTDGGMTQTQKLEFFNNATKKFKQKYPSAWEKTKTWLEKKGLGKKKNWVAVWVGMSVIYFFGELNSGAIPDYSDVQDPKQYAAAIIDATGKAALAPIGVGVIWDASGLDIESDYFNTLSSFRDYLVDKQNFSKETVATLTRPVFGDVGKYEAMGPDNVKRTYIYDEDQGTFFPYDPSKDVNKAPNTPNPQIPNTTTYTNDPTGYKKYVDEVKGLDRSTDPPKSKYGPAGVYVWEDGKPLYKDTNGNWQIGSHDGTTFVTN